MQKQWDSDVKHFFLKILNSIALGLIWMIIGVTAGLYFQLAYSDGKPVIYTVLFYVFMAVTLVLLIRYLYRVWKNS
jgi:hypothetical protein